MDIKFEYYLTILNNRLNRDYSIKSTNPNQNSFKILLDNEEKPTTITFYNTGSVLVQPSDEEIKKILEKEFKRLLEKVIKKKTKNDKPVQKKLSETSVIVSKMESVNFDETTDDSIATSGQVLINDEATKQNDSIAPPKKLKAFVVHGHNNSVREHYCGILDSLGIEPVVLENEENKGLTIIEKLEKNVDKCDFGVILVTNDNIINTEDSKKHCYPRLNIIYELGYLHGRLGRGHTILVEAEEGQRLQNSMSDIQGLVYVSNYEKFTKEVKSLKETFTL